MEGKKKKVVGEEMGEKKSRGWVRRSGRGVRTNGGDEEEREEKEKEGEKREKREEEWE